MGVIAANTENIQRPRITYSEPEVIKGFKDGGLATFVESH